MIVIRVNIAYQRSFDLRYHRNGCMNCEIVLAIKCDVVYVKSRIRCDVMGWTSTSENTSIGLKLVSSGLSLSKNGTNANHSCASFTAFEIALINAAGLLLLFGFMTACLLTMVFTRGSICHCTINVTYGFKQNNKKLHA